MMSKTVMDTAVWIIYSVHPFTQNPIGEEGKVSTNVTEAHDTV